MGFFFSSRRRHTRYIGDWSSDVCSSDLVLPHLQKPTIEHAIHATAALPTILAAFHRRRKGLDRVKPRPDLGHAANYLYMLNGEEARPELVRALNTYLVLLADHGMNASTLDRKSTRLNSS